MALGSHQISLNYSVQDFLFITFCRRKHVMMTYTEVSLHITRRVFQCNNLVGHEVGRPSNRSCMWRTMGGPCGFVVASVDSATSAVWGISCFDRRHPGQFVLFGHYCRTLLNCHQDIHRVNCTY
jgi:hypothetical protein